MGAVGALLLGLLAWWMLGGESAGPEQAPEHGSSVVVEDDRVSRKMALRADAPDIDPVTLVGVVRDEKKRPLAGAVVLLTPKSFESSMGRAGERPQPVHVRTDAGGGFSIADVPVGRYTVSASAKGYLAAGHLAVRVLPGVDPAPIELLLKKGGHTLSGRVEDISGGPVEAALVSVIRHDGQNLLRQSYAPTAGISDEDGAFEMTLPDGTYSATVTHPDYVMAMKTFEIADGPRAVAFRVTPGAVIEGVVRVRGSEDAVADAIVVATAPSKNPQGTPFSMRGFGEHRVVADENGRFRLAGLPSGLLQLNAVANGHASAEMTEVSVGIAQTASDVVVWVEPAYTISGFVVPRGSEADEGIEGVWVGALSLRPPGLSVARQPSEADGFFEIPGVQPGSYMVAALGEDHLPNLTGTSATVEDEDVSGVLVEMAAGVTIRGRIDPPGPATVSLRVNGEGMGLTDVLSGIGNALVRTRTDEDGRFELRPVSPGELEIVAEADDGSRGALKLEVSDEGEDDVVVDVEPRVSFEGTVVTAGGEPVTDAKVAVTRVDKDPEPMALSFSVNDNPLFGDGAPTGEDGTFTVRGLEPGEYEVTVRAGKGPSLKFGDGEQVDEPRRYTIPDDGLRGVELVVEGRGGEITGVVIDADGAPVADAWVTASLEGGGKAWMKEFVRARRPRRGRELEATMQDEPSSQPGAGALSGFAAEDPVLTNGSGRFTISGLREGTYRVVAEAAGGGRRVSEDGVELGADLTLEVETLAGIEGQLTKGSTPVPSYALTVKGPMGRSKQVSNAKGEFYVDGLDPGTYTVQARADVGVAKAEVEVEEGSTAQVNLEAEPFGTLTGTVLSATGEPLAGLFVMAQPKGGTADFSNGLQMLMGGGPRTDRRGEFELEGVAPGEGHLMIFDPDGGEGGGARAAYEVGAGETEDLGTITAVKAGEVPVPERGTLGFRTTVRDWTHRPLAPEAESDDDEPPVDPERERLWVRAVTEEGPAAAAGLAPGDEILGVDDQDVASLGARTAASMLGPSHFRVGDDVTLRILRDGSQSRITVTATKRDLSALGMGGG
ncbi:MAG: carboxypeptidase regulatory-like domain-containing protein [Nannocystaceae bacterium]|nr:carboxypeptidase-like regulatory domain-containing protein [bacterium]